MPQPPTGTVTFLFSDIEGSSKLWEKHPEPMRLALARHDAILRGAIEGNAGYVFKTMGDAFLAAFETATDALNAALQAQSALCDEKWPMPEALRARIALHTGAAEIRDGDYFGQTLNRVARLLAAGHGGQTLLSLATGELVRDQMPDGATLRELGEHRLKDLNRSEHVFQLEAPGLEGKFPPLRSLENFPNNLPVQLTSFVGREREMEQVKRLLGETHLLTLTGTGGTGKTRLSLQAAADVLENFPDGTWFIEFATVRDPGQVPETVALALGVREEPGRALQATLVNHLKNRTALLLFDNCEQIVAACAQLAEALLRACPNLRIMASSREPFGIAGEKTLAVPPLSMPDLSERRLGGSELFEALSQFEAVRLFVDRALAVRSDFKVTNENAPYVAQICWRLDGIPLAIELAAARVKVLSLKQIATRLDDRFSLLTGGSRTAVPRQQTLRALIDWSHDILTPAEQALFRRLTVFARGRTLEAVEAVCATGEVESWQVLDLLSQLVDKSLVYVERSPEGEARYYLLESVWRYALAKFQESPEYAEVRDRHLEYFLRFAEEAAPQLIGPDQKRWIELVDLEHSNLRWAIEWSLEREGGSQAGLRIAAAIARFWDVRSHLKRGREACAALLARPENAGHTSVRADVLVGASQLAWVMGDEQTERAYDTEALAIFREIGDKRGTAQILVSHAMTARLDGDMARARSLLEESLALADEAEDKRSRAASLFGLALLERETGRLAEARVLSEQSLALYRELGDLWLMGQSLGITGMIAIAQGDYAAATPYIRECMTTASAIGAKWPVPYLLEAAGALALSQGKLDMAASCLGAASALRERMSVTLLPPEQAPVTHLIDQTRSALGAEKFESAWATGRGMDIDQALRFALDRPAEMPAV